MGTIFWFVSGVAVGWVALKRPEWVQGVVDWMKTAWSNKAE